MVAPDSPPTATTSPRTARRPVDLPQAVPSEARRQPECDGGMTCPRNASRAVARENSDLRCVLCGYVVDEGRPSVEAWPGLVALVAAARRYQVRTLGRWFDAGLVRGGPPRGSGREHLVDVASVAAFIKTRTSSTTCERCGGEIERGSRVRRRWCSVQCKSAFHHAALDRRAARRAAWP